uniref:Putative transcription initiation factor tfiid subunit 3 n=1 Tax=Ornithodoros turicata TaxID=34597 RepID=A0A2R5LBF0_9ACAR
MQQVFASFPEVLLLDATYRTNKLRMPLFVFLVEDGSGRSHVVAYAFVASEQQHVVTHLLQIFVRENGGTAETNVVIVDKDFTEIAAIREAFPSEPAVQLCQFHVMKAFRTAAGQLSKSAQERDRLVSSFSEMLNAPTPEMFGAAQGEFLRYANEDACTYFNKNWAPIPEMWARHLCDQVFTAGNNTTNRVESHNGKLKNVLSSSGKLHEALRALMKVSSSMLQEARHQATLLQTCNFYSHNTSGEVEKICFKELTPYACSLIVKEMKKARERLPGVQQVAPEVYSVMSSCSDTCHKVSLNEQTCSCTMFSKMGLLCRHFLAVCDQFNKIPDLKKAVKACWFKSYQLRFMAESATVMANQEPSDNDAAEILTLPGPSYQKMNRNQRFNYAMRTFKAIADLLADCPTALFVARLEFLEDIHTAWLRGEEVVEEADSSNGLVNPFQQVHNNDQVNCKANSSTMQLGHSNKDLLHRHPDSNSESGEPGQGALCTTQATLRTENVPRKDVILPEPVTDNSSNQTPALSQLKLPMVKSRGRPKKRPTQRQNKRPRDSSSTQPSFVQLPEIAQHKLLLRGIVGKAVCDNVLNCGYIVEECDIEVRPHVLPSGLLDYRVKLQKLKKFFTEDAWVLLTSSVATKKTNQLWLCRDCNEQDDGQIKMICCDHCLEWFHWTCAGVTRADSKQKLWFCVSCKQD